MLDAGQDLSGSGRLFHQGKNIRSYSFLGAHSRAGGGFAFCVWAPHAKAISVVGDFNGWETGADPMGPLPDDPSLWRADCPGARAGDHYKYAITTADGRLIYKSDPYAFMAEPPQGDAVRRMSSRLTEPEGAFSWTDGEWISRRGGDPRKVPMNIYEVHLGSWKRHGDGSYYSYRETADELIPYAEKMGYTHLEFLPLTEHPYDGSWGYQNTGYFALTSRYGEPADFMYLVNKAHQRGIGILLDWVPAHFPKDDFGLVDFDGDFLYEDSDPFRREHECWGTRAFDFGRPEVRSFLISSAVFFCDVYHIDGLRVDAVSAMLYLDYEREPGKWRPNEEGGRENPDAIRFLQELNRAVMTEHPGVLMIAEEFSSWPMTTMPPGAGGLGFSFKWNMGWMNDSLEYFSTDPLFRRGIHNKLTFSLTYSFSENYILPISHDEVVHGKRSLLDKMPGSYEEKFAGLRAFYAYMMTHPGKKLLFMGCEFGQFIEWNEAQGLDWLLLDFDQHRKLRDYLRELNHLYRNTPALWSLDHSWDGFRWIDADDADHNIYIYVRVGEDGSDCLCILNLSGAEWRNVRVPVPSPGTYARLLDSDMIRFGGAGRRRGKLYHTAEGRDGGPAVLRLDLPPLSALLLERRDEPNE